MFLDAVLWQDNISAGIIAHTLDDTRNIFRDKIKYAFDHLDPRIRALFRTVGDSASELSFTHGSHIRVGTSLRGATLQYLHISEFGKICAKFPERAREIATGSFNTVHSGQKIIVESTAEGKEGYFHDLCETSIDYTDKRPLSTLDFRKFFFPWYREPSYADGTPRAIPHDLEEYFGRLQAMGIALTDPQKWWYTAKFALQKEDMFREFPSTADEAFFASQEGYWYAAQLKELHDKGQITTLAYDKTLPVHTAWDLGQADKMSIWFFQLPKSGNINLIDYFERSDCPLDMISAMLSQKGYTYGKHIWPKDANARDRAGVTFVKQAREFGLNGIVLEDHALSHGINLVKTTLSKCFFDGKKCNQGIVCLENYKKTWSTSIGGYTSDPVHDKFSHGADAFRYLVAGLSKVNDFGSLEGDYKAVRSFWGG